MENKVPLQPKKVPAGGNAPPVAAPSSGGGPVAPAKAQRPPPPALVWPKIPTAMKPSLPQKQGPRPMGTNTIFGAHVAQFKKPASQGLEPLASVAPSKGFSAVKLRNDALQEAALGDKGLKPDQLHVVLEFVEWARQSACNVEETRQRSALSQMLGFWVKQVAPHVPVAPNVVLEPFQTPW